MKEFAIYTALRLGIFVRATPCSAGSTSGSSAGPAPWCGRSSRALVVSALLSWKYLAPQRERFAAVVQGRAERASARYEAMRSKEDED